MARGMAAGVRSLERSFSRTAERTKPWMRLLSRKRTSLLVGWTLTSTSWGGMEIKSTAAGCRPGSVRPR